jgi:fructose-1,6-bisphosphatase/inositol monophosphatase family enzyme
MIPDVINILEEIDRAIKPVPGEGFDTWKKPDASYVTSLDIQLHNLIVEIIKDHYPGHNVLYEEGDHEDPDNSSTSGCTWVIDPIDGTNNMEKGEKEYGTAVGVMHNRQIFAAPIGTYPLFSHLTGPPVGPGVCLYSR